MRQRLLYGLYRLNRRAPWGVILVVLLLAGGAAYSLQDLRVNSSFEALLPADDPILDRFRQYGEVLRSTEKVTVLLRLTTPSLTPGEGVARLLETAQRLVEILEPHPEILSVSYRREEPELPTLPINLLALSEESLESLRRSLAELRTLESPAAVAPGPAPGARLPALPEEPLPEVYARIRTALVQLLSGLAPVFRPEEFAQAVQQIDKHLQTLQGLNAEIAQALQELPERLKRAETQVQALSETVASWQSALQPLPPPSELEEVLLSRDRRALLVEIQPRLAPRVSLEYNRRILQVIRSALQDLRLEERGIEWGLKGNYVFTVESDDALRRDMNRTAVLTAVGVFLLFVIVLKRLFYPLVATLPVGIALVFTLAGAQALFGELNLLTAFLPAIVLGLGIDYGIQFISHYLEVRQGTRRLAPALRDTLMQKGQAMLVAGTVTSSVLFGLGIVSRTPGLVQMGVILGLGVLLSALLTLLLLPALLLAAHRLRGRRARGRPPRPWDLSPLARMVQRGRWAIVVLVLAGSGAFAVPASEIRFAFVSESLMPTRLPSQQVRAFIAENFDLPQGPDVENLFFFFVDDDEETVRSVAQGLLALEAIDQVTSFYSLIPDPKRLEEVQARLLEVRALDLLGPLEGIRERLRRLQRQLGLADELRAELVRLEEALRDAADDALAAWGDEEFAATFTELASSTRSLRLRLEATDVEALLDRLQALLVDLDALAEQVRRITAAIPSPEEMEAILAATEQTLRARFTTEEGEMIVIARVRPEWLWNSVKYDAFVRQAQAVWPRFLGQPMIRATLEDYMKQDFWRSTALAVLLIFVVLQWDFGRTQGLRFATWLSLFTLGLGYLWLLGTMGLLRIDFNVANVLLSPLLVGLGVDNCVYLLHRYRDLGFRSVERALASTVLPILANALATMIGFGSLLLAETPVLKVLGQSAVMGIGYMTLLGLTFLPAALALRRP